MVVITDIMEQDIDLLRIRMHRISSEVKVLTHPRLIRISRQLDRKLNSYYRLLLSVGGPGERTS